MRKTKYKTTIVLALIVFFIILFIPSSNAGECSYGALKAWYSKDGVHWRNATVDNAIGKLGEPFYIKAIVEATTDLMSIDIKIWETGETDAESSTFERLEGPECFFSYYDIIHVSKNDTYIYIWKFCVKPDTEWVDGNAPLNIYTQFDKNEDDTKGISFTLVNMYIQNILWENYTENMNDNTNTSYDNNTGSDIIPANNPSQPTQNTNKTPDFKITGMVMALVLIMLLLKKNS